MKPFITSRRQVLGGPIERRFSSSKKETTFVQNGAPAHTSKAFKGKSDMVSNFIAKKLYTNL